MDLNALAQNASTTLINVAWKIAGAVALWLVGRWLISLALDMIGRAATRQQFDVTLTRYLQTALKIILNIALIVAILGFFGVETTTFAALLAAGGVADVPGRTQADPQPRQHADHPPHRKFGAQLSDQGRHRLLEHLRPDQRILRHSHRGTRAAAA